MGALQSVKIKQQEKIVKSKIFDEWVSSIVFKIYIFESIKLHFATIYFNYQNTISYIYVWVAGVVLNDSMHTFKYNSSSIW